MKTVRSLRSGFFLSPGYALKMTKNQSLAGPVLFVQLNLPLYS